MVRARADPDRSFFWGENNWPKPKTEPDLVEPRREEQTGTLRTGLTRTTLAEYDLSIPFLDRTGLGPPLKLPGLLELLSNPWKTILPLEFILGLSTDAPLTGGTSVLLIELRPVRAASKRARIILTRGGILSESRERRGISYSFLSSEEEEDRDKRADIETESASESRS